MLTEFCWRLLDDVTDTILVLVNRPLPADEDPNVLSRHVAHRLIIKFYVRGIRDKDQAPDKIGGQIAPIANLIAVCKQVLHANRCGVAGVMRGQTAAGRAEVKAKDVTHEVSAVILRV